MYNSAYFQKRYEYIRRLGEGGSACVALVRDRNIKKYWAAKFVRKTGKIFDADSEIETLKALDYHMFPRIVDAFNEGEDICIITDYVDGENLKSYLDREGPLPVQIVIKFYEELLEALIYLHSRSPSILYLDMKPENIMLTKSLEIKLIDFGIARTILTNNKCFGTKGYSPPEQYSNEAIVDEKADVFALSMTIYTLLTGKVPKTDLISQQIAIKNSSKIPHELKKILLKCSDKNPAKRPRPKDILTMLKSMKKGRNTSVVIMLIGAIVVINASILLTVGHNIARKIETDRNLKEMINLSNEHVMDGEYDRDGINIICGYINGGYLDEQSRLLYTYKVALNLFNVQKDYYLAYPYLKQIEKSGYADVSEYLDVCERMKGFSDSKDIIKFFEEEIEENKYNSDKYRRK
ncbi:MAG: serine/threonine-protein kinase [Lachnospiraceae bacterium]|nr:serine/threonine-protein kinase [Lachnospiraceae bacterium]